MNKEQHEKFKDICCEISNEARYIESMMEKSNEYFIIKTLEFTSIRLNNLSKELWIIWQKMKVDNVTPS